MHFEPQLMGCFKHRCLDQFSALPVQRDLQRFSPWLVAAKPACSEALEKFRRFLPAQICGNLISTDLPPGHSLTYCDTVGR